MKNNRSNNFSFLGILFVVFTIAIGVFALNEFKNQHSNVTSNLSNRITVKFQKDSIYKKFFQGTHSIDLTKKNNLTKTLIISSQKEEPKKDSLAIKNICNN